MPNSVFKRKRKTLRKISHQLSLHFSAVAHAQSLSYPQTSGLKAVFTFGFDYERIITQLSLEWIRINLLLIRINLLL